MSTVIYYCATCGGELLRQDSIDESDTTHEWPRLSWSQHDLSRCVANLKQRIEQLEARIDFKPF